MVNFFVDASFVQNFLAPRLTLVVPRLWKDGLAQIVGKITIKSTKSWKLVMWNVTQVLEKSKSSLKLQKYMEANINAIAIFKS